MAPAVPWKGVCKCVCVCVGGVYSLCSWRWIRFLVTARVHVSISLCVVFPCSRVCCVGVLCIVEGKIYTRSLQTLNKQFDITYENKWTVNMAHWQYIVQQYKHLCYPASSCNLNNTFPSTHSQPDDYHQLLLTACQFKMANNGLCLLCRIGYPFFLSFLPWCHGYQGLNFRVRRSTPLYLRTVNIHHALQPWRNPFSTHRGCSLLNSP